MGMERSAKPVFLNVRENPLDVTLVNLIVRIPAKLLFEFVVSESHAYFRYV